MCRRTTLSALLVLFLTSCIPLSIAPIYSADVLLYDQELEGVWEEGGETWTFTRAEGKSYRLQISNGEETLEYLVHLVKLREVLFLDLLVTAAEGLPESAELLGLQLIPAHTFLKLEKTKDGMNLYFMDSEWIEERLENHRLRIPHVKVESMDGWPVFTASTARMQQFLKRWANTKAAWRDALQLRPVCAAAPPAPPSAAPSGASPTFPKRSGA